MDGPKRLDALPLEEAREAFHRCCGSARWAERMVKGRPYRSEGALMTAAERAFAVLGRADWLEAFSHHPRIGDRQAPAARFTLTRQWSAGEQGGVSGANDDVLARLAETNRAYAERFGYTFIVCATGRSASEMLAALEERLGNDPDREIAVAAAEQVKITAIRLTKLLTEVL